MIECSTSGGQHSGSCENNGGSDELDAETSRYFRFSFKKKLYILIENNFRMQITSTSTSCNLRINSAAIDDGTWKCSVTNPRSPSAQMG